MKTDRLESAGTYYASPERTDKIHLQKEFDQINNNPVMDTLLKSVGGLLAILDQNRQILSVNRSLADVLHIEDIEEVLGLRPGEALNCRFADCEPGGCGTSQFCSSCGAAVAIVTSLGTERTVERNCYLQLGEGKSAVNLAFQVRAHPVKSGGSTYVLLFMQDITRQEQRASWNALFFMI